MKSNFEPNRKLAQLAHDVVDMIVQKTEMPSEAYTTAVVVLACMPLADKLPLRELVEDIFKARQILHASKE